jgi:hypothetical protein
VLTNAIIQCLINKSLILDKNNWQINQIFMKFTFKMIKTKQLLGLLLIIAILAPIGFSENTIQVADAFGKRGNGGINQDRNTDIPTPQPVPSYCGDSIKNGNEECDAEDFGNQSCLKSGFTVGTLTCTASCTIETSQCTDNNASTPNDSTNSDSGGGHFEFTIYNETTSWSNETDAPAKWYTNVPATTRVVYDTISHDLGNSDDNYGYALSMTDETSIDSNHQILLTDLSPGTQYFWRPVSAYNGEEKVGAEVSFATIGNPPAADEPANEISQAESEENTSDETNDKPEESNLDQGATAVESIEEVNDSVTAESGNENKNPNGTALIPNESPLVLAYETENYLASEMPEDKNQEQSVIGTVIPAKANFHGLWTFLLISFTILVIIWLLVWRRRGEKADDSATTPDKTPSQASATTPDWSPENITESQAEYIPERSVENSPEWSAESNVATSAEVTPERPAENTQEMPAENISETPEDERPPSDYPTDLRLP